MARVAAESARHIADGNRSSPLDSECANLLKFTADALEHDGVSLLLVRST